MPGEEGRPFHMVTPLLESAALSRAAGTKVYMKLENTQPSGSFKIRGIGYFCQQVARRGCQHLVCSSGGNAGLATAYAARKLGIPATVIVPGSTPPLVVRKLEEQRAEVEVFGKVWDDANDRALALAEKDGWVNVHPFDHPFVCVATCLGAKTVAQRALDCASEWPIISHVLEDVEAVAAVEHFLDDERMLVEPACGASLALLYSGHLQQLQAEGRLCRPLPGPVVVIVCGGSGIQLEGLRALKSRLGMP